MLTDHMVVAGNGAQTIKTVPRDRQGRPTVVSSATYGIDNMPYATEEASRTITAHGTAATVDTASTTTTAACGAGVNFREIPLTATTNFAEGKHYIIQEQSAGGRRELVFAEELDTSNKKIFLRHGLTREFSSGAYVKGCEVSTSFPAAIANDEDWMDRGGGPFAITWVASVGGVTEDWREFIWLVRKSPIVPITIEDVYEIDQTLPDALGKRVKPENLLMAAFKDYSALLRAHGEDENYIHSENGLRALAYRAAWHARINMTDEHSERKAELWLIEWKKLTADLTTGRVPYRTVATDRGTDTTDFETSKRFVNPVRLS